MTVRELIVELNNIRDEYLDADVSYAVGIYSLEPVEKVDVIDEDMFPFVVLRPARRRRIRRK